ncbi:hypothetical protein NUF81_000655 [Yersinia enterocolitica]|nr:hypothetical protein [Yersinia enterocolitica]
MGCDIHLYREKKVSRDWVTADVWEEQDDGDDGVYFEVPWRNRFTDRNYKLFGLLSKGVRCEIPFAFKERGIPFNACQEVADNSARWEGDGHSHSYLYLHELKDMSEFIQRASINVTGMMERDQLKKLQGSIRSGSPDWNLLYPYCRMGGSSSYVDFDIDVPAAFIMANCLDSIISSFDGVDGDNHRIVFWFDN